MNNKYINRIITLLIIGLFLSTSCAKKTYPTTKTVTKKSPKTSVTKSEPKKTSKDLNVEAEKEADEAGRAILETGRKMAVIEKVIIKGSCWNWVNECFIRAGYGTNKHIAYKSKKSGPYVDINKIKPGDWIYYINYSYNKVEHSGIFVRWVDKKKKIGVTLSYGGEHRKEPGRYREYLLKDVYYITRAGKK